MTNSFEAWTEDRRYGLKIPSATLDKMLALCTESRNLETGGVFVGEYSTGHNCAIVTDCSSAPHDSKSGDTHFYRGVSGLSQWLKRLWKHRDKQYYLGEWHYHPKADPFPSKTDLDQMRQIAFDASYHCPEPVLFVIGGDADKGWRYDAIVYIRELGQMTLHKHNVVGTRF